MKIRRFVLCMLLPALLLTGCSHAESPAAQQEEIIFADTSGMDFSFTERELAGEYEPASATAIRSESGSISIDGRGVRISGRNLIIEDEGTYILSGSFDGVMLTVSVPEDEKVQLVLEGAGLHNAEGPAIYIRSADKVFLTLAEGTENSLSDGAEVSLEDDGSSLDGAVFSRSDLCINGSGSLTVSGNAKHGIVSRDALVIANCRLDVTAVKHGLHGKDCVKLHGADVRIVSGGDGIQSDNDKNANRGYVYLEASKLKIIAGNDGVQAETVLKITGSDISISSGGGSGQALTEADGSCKGLKAGQDILLEGGSISIDSRDDCIHAGGNAAVYGGTFSLSSGDDGLHADEGVLFSGGSMEILKSYEGVEGSRMHISGGELRVTASDDGLNLAGGNDSSAMGERPGRGMFDVEDGAIEISGGRIFINAQGDGIDSNGTVAVSGGVTLVSGPTNSGNAAFDHNGASVTGGVLMAAGSAGMAQGFSSAENQGALLVTFDLQAAGSSIALCDAAGSVVAAFTPEKEYQSLVVTAPGIQAGESYILLAGAALTEADENGFAQTGTASGGAELSRIEMDSALYNSGGSGGRGFGGGMHGMGERGGLSGKGFRQPEDMPEPPESRANLPEGLWRPGGNPPEMPEGLLSGMPMPEKQGSIPGMRPQDQE